MFCNYGGVYCSEIGVYVLVCTGVLVCGDACCVSSAIKCGLVSESGRVGLCIVSLCSGCDGCYIYV